jgi:hypothetical protein
MKDAADAAMRKQLYDEILQGVCQHGFLQAEDLLLRAGGDVAKALNHHFEANIDDPGAYYCSIRAGTLTPGMFHGLSLQLHLQ